MFIYFTVFSFGHERYSGAEPNVNSWYNYFSDSTGLDAFDIFDLNDLAKSTAYIHSLIDHEGKVTGGAHNVIVAGCSQGGTLALHAGLTYRHFTMKRVGRRIDAKPLAAVIALRTILLEETPIYGGVNPPVEVFSAALDKVGCCIFWFCFLWTFFSKFVRMLVWVINKRRCRGNN